MNNIGPDDIFAIMIDKLKSFNPENWKNINDFISNLSDNNIPEKKPDQLEFMNTISRGIAFLTYDYGIDGVSIEISKYAKALQKIFPDSGSANIYFSNRGC